MHFLHNSPFHEKTFNSENFGRKSLLLSMEHFFFSSKFEITKWNGAINKQKQPPEQFYKKKVFLQISQNSQENTCTIVSLSVKLQAFNYIKKQTLAQVFSC